MNSILRRSFKLARMTSVQIRGMHASESPRFREFRRENPRQVINFIQSLASNEEKLAFWHYDAIKRFENPSERKKKGMPNDFYNLKVNLLQQPDELTPQMFYQLTDLTLFNRIEKIILSRTLRKILTDQSKALPTSDISFALDSLSFLSGIENAFWMDQSLLSRHEFRAINAKDLEEFYSRLNSKFGLRDNIIFAFLYAYQSGYKSSLVQGILNFIHSNYDEIDSDDACKTLLTFLKVIGDDFEKTSQESHSIEQHPLFATFKKFDQKFTFRRWPSIKYDSLKSLIQMSLKSKMKDSLPNISKFLWQSFIENSKKERNSSQIYMQDCFALCEQSIDLNETEVEDVADNVTEYWRRTDFEFNQMTALRVLSRLAFKGL